MSSNVLAAATSIVLGRVTFALTPIRLFSHASQLQQDDSRYDLYQLLLAYSYTCRMAVLV